MAQFNSRQTFGYNKFDRSHRHFTSCNMNTIYPIRWSKVVPGEYTDREIDAFLRTDALANPAFADIDCEIAHFFVSMSAIDPRYKIRCAEFEQEGKNAHLPCLTFRESYTQMQTAFGVGTLGDYLGMFLGNSNPADIGGTSVAASVKFDLGPFFAYQMICDRFYSNARLSDVNFWRKVAINLNAASLDPLFRTEDLESAIQLVSSTAHWGDITKLRSSLWKPDYFTSSRPTADGTELPLPSIWQGFSPNAWSSNPTLADAVQHIKGLEEQIHDTINNPQTRDSNPATIPALWDMELLQKVRSMIEHEGYSYFDYMQTIYGINPDQREVEGEYPVYLGGGSSPLKIDAVTSTEAGTALGTQGGQMTGYESRNGFSRRFTQAGYLMSVLILRPQAAYLDGINRHFFDVTLADQLIPALADLGDQPISQLELLSSANITEGNPFSAIFGFVDRYQHYRTMYNRASNTMRTTEKNWLIARETTAGTISEDWVKSNASYAPWNVTDKNVMHFYLRCHIKEHAALPLPVKSRPYIW